MKPLMPVLALTLLAGCSSSSPADRTAGQAGQPPAASSGPSAPAPATTAPVVKASPTPGLSAMPRVRRIPALDGDVDGDGQPDVVRVAGRTITVVLSGSGRLVSAPTGADGPATRAGAVDVDRDGRSEVVLLVGHGASTASYALFRFDGRILARVDRASGPLVLLAGGTVTHGDGFSCTTNGRLVLRQATSNQGKVFHVVSTVLRLAGARAVVVSRSGYDGRQDDPRVHRAYAVDCGSVGEGG